jgi:C-terminal processing protease CtpA/Prc/tricorn protease-like protein
MKGNKLKKLLHNQGFLFKPIYLAILCIFSISLVAYEPNFIEEPTLSPDGEFIAFMYQQDLWEVPFSGGVARRLTATNDRKLQPAYSPDGEWISFRSDRDGRFKFYRMPRSGGAAELLTSEEFSFLEYYHDSLSVLGSKVQPGEQPFLVKYDINGKRPLEVAPFTGTFSTVSNDGKLIVFDRRGLPFRPAYSGSVKGNLWLYDTEKNTFTQITDTPYTVRYPVFSRVQPNRIYFAESDSQLFQLHYMDNFDITTKTQITNLENWNARKPSIARQNDRIVFEHFNEIWSYDPQTNRVEKVDIQILEHNRPFPNIRKTYLSELTHAAISPNQEFIVFSHKYDLFTVPTKGGEVKQITFDQAGIYDMVIADDNETIYFLSGVNGVPKLYKTKITKLNDIKFIKWSDDKFIQSISINSAGEIFLRYDVGTTRNLFGRLGKNDKVTEILPNETNTTIPIVTKDKQKKIYIVADPRNRNNSIRVKDMKSQKNEDVFISTNRIGHLILDPTEKNMFYSSNNEIFMVNMVRDTFEPENHWDKILGNRSRTTRTDDKWDITRENFGIRSQFVVRESEWNFPLFATADSTLYYFSQSAIKSVKFNGSGKEEVISLRGGAATIVHIADDQTHIYYVQNNKLYRLNVKTKKAELINFQYVYTYDREVLNRVLFDQIWAVFGHNFYDPNMHGVDWQATYETFAPYMASVQSMQTMSRIVDEMIGRVNASHTGFRPRDDENRRFFERAFVGVSFDYSRRLPVGIRIKNAYFGSELSQKYGVRDNDLVLEINGVSINADTEIDPLFVDYVKKDIRMRVQTSSGIVNATVKGLNVTDHHQLSYEDAVLKSFRQVTDATNGRIGYLRIQRMNQPALRRFEQDFLALNANTEGMIIDVRANSGGRISGDLFDIITRRQRAHTYSRMTSIEPIPSPRNLYQNPIVLLIDEDSFSDAEIFGILFRDLNIGTIIGMPTSGSVIGTNDFNLIDGSSMRMPHSGWFTMEGVNMELTGATPDILVPRLPHHHVQKIDPQLEKAIEVILNAVMFSE